jgi:hypothetical protein
VWRGRPRPRRLAHLSVLFLPAPEPCRPSLRTCDLFDEAGPVRVNERWTGISFRDHAAVNHQVSQQFRFLPFPKCTNASPPRAARFRVRDVLLTV